MDSSTEELRHAHDVLAEWYAERLAGALEPMPVERAVLNLFGELTLAAGVGSDVADVGCGTGLLEPYLASRGLSPHGVDLSPGMIEVARRDHPAFRFEVADLRDLPFPDASQAGVVCWYSLIFLAPPDRAPAFAEVARVIRPGGYLVTAFKDGDGRHRRSGRSAGLGVEFDSYWLPTREMADLAVGAGFDVVFQGGRPPQRPESCPQGYLLLRAPRSRWSDSLVHPPLLDRPGAPESQDRVP